MSDAAAHFWPSLIKEERTERVHETLVEIMTREERGETHKISWWAKWMFVRLHQRAVKNQREIPVEDMAVYLATERAAQFDCVAAHEAAKFVFYLPPRHRKVMLRLIDGANPLEISDELQMPIVSVLATIREARLWLSDGGCYLETTSARVKAFCSV